MIERTPLAIVLPLLGTAGCFTNEPGLPPPSPLVEQSYTVTLDDELVMGHTLRELLAAVDTSQVLTMERWRPAESATLGNTLSMQLEPNLSAPINATEWRYRTNEDAIASVYYEIPLGSCGAHIGTDTTVIDSNVREFGIGWANPDDHTGLPADYVEPEGFEGYAVAVRCGTHSYWGDFVSAQVPQDTLDKLLGLAAPANVSGDSLQWQAYASWAITNMGSSSEPARAGFGFTFDDPDGVSPEPTIPAQINVLEATFGWTYEDL